MTSIMNCDVIDTSYLDDITKDCDEGDDLFMEDDYDEEENAIINWLWTFPLIQDKVLDNVTFNHNWYCCDKIADALLNIVREICSVPISSNNQISSKNECWNEISTILHSQSLNPKKQSKEHYLSLLFDLLCFAVSESCASRATYIAPIMTFDQNTQLILKQIIERGTTDLSDTEDASKSDVSYVVDETYLDQINVGARSESEHGRDNRFQNNYDKENMVNTPLSRKRLSLGRNRQTPRGSSSRKQGGSSNSKKRFFSNSPLSPLDGNNFKRELTKQYENEDLKNENIQLSNEVAMLREREIQLSKQVDDLQAHSRENRMKVESAALSREAELHNHYSEKIDALEKELKLQNESLKESASCKEELISLRDEVDVLKHSSEKLVQTEEQLRRLKEKMEQMKDVSEALSREEKAHSDAVSKCLQLEEEIAILHPLRRQLEEYKTRAVDAEVKITEYEEDIKTLKENNNSLKEIINELRSGSVKQQAETDGLRKKLEIDNALGKDKDLVSVGGGMTELNPALKEELLRLRSENNRLKATASKREDDFVQSLEQKLDDSERLATKYKENYVNTKNLLGETKDQLKMSVQRETALNHRVQELEESIYSQSLSFEQERSEHQKALRDSKTELHETTKQLTHHYESEKQQLLNELNQTYRKQLSSVEEKLTKSQLESKNIQESLTKQITSTKDEHKLMLKKIRNENDELVSNMKRKYESDIDEIAKRSKLEKEKLLEQGKALLNDTKEKAKAEKEEMTVRFEQIQTDLKEQLEQLHQKYQDDEMKALNTIHKYRKRIKQAEVRLNEYIQDLSESEEITKRLEKEKSNLKEENDRFRRQLSGRSGNDGNMKSHFEELQREFKTLVEENKMLKGSRSTTFASPKKKSFDSSLHQLRVEYGGGLNNNSSIVQLRTEYEEMIDKINDEKRELVMKNSAAITDIQKANHRTFELEQEIELLKMEKTSLQLQLGRNKRNNADSHSSSDVSSKMSVTTESSSPNLTSAGVPLKSPEFQASMDKFKTKLVGRLSSQKLSPKQVRIDRSEI